ncbi:hypothetical protein SLEP1_g29706 [Rubroshorea leprosula]|uniref:Reverse transcriptase domain-containing protein n=1 Tax=Rubroshorea leprosula TaxID=152421 RepID=A0AAV5K4S2_9ROSI|nr:hypothetical protein SLEP1_g29706 [Rubroshorea leprosula]
MAESSVSELALGERLALTVDEDVGLSLDDGDDTQQCGGGDQWCLVGIVLTRKRYHMESMERTLVDVWRPVKGMHMRILGNNLFAFYFCHPVDMQRVLAEGPWRFDNHIMVLQEAQGGRQGNIWGSKYIRVRVGIDARRPLRRGVKLTLKGRPLWVSFRYERLLNFSYCYGMLDHVERDCEVGLELESMGMVEWPYNDELRPIPWRIRQGRGANSGGWLRDASCNPVAEVGRRRRQGLNMEKESNAHGQRRDLRKGTIDSLVQSSAQKFGDNGGGVDDGKRMIEVNAEINRRELCGLKEVDMVRPITGKDQSCVDIVEGVGPKNALGMVQGPNNTLIVDNIGGQGSEMDIAFVLSSGPSNTPFKRRARKKEARERKSSSSQLKHIVSRVKRKDEQEVVVRNEVEGGEKRGLGNPRAVRNLIELVRWKKPIVVFLSETRLDKRRMEGVRRQLGFKNCFTIDRVGTGGGLAMLWQDGVILSLLSYSQNHIDMEVLGWREQRWRFTGFYGHPERSNRRRSWALLRELATKSSLPWVIGGDFNDILDQEEKRGGKPQPEWLLSGFQEAVVDCELTEVWMIGFPYTWTRGGVEEKLDRILASKEWQASFPQAMVRSLPLLGSDHSPLLMNFMGKRKDYGRKQARRFRIKRCEDRVQAIRQLPRTEERLQEEKEVLREVEEWLSREEEIATSYFNDLFSSSHSINIEQVMRCIERQGTSEDNRYLLKEFKAEEVIEAIFQMHSLKAPGPYGMSPGFFQHFWPVVGKGVIEACLEFLNNGNSLPKELNITHIIMIPKVGEPKVIGDLRPISLCNVIYRIIAKVLANRLKQVLSRVISVEQSAFLPGRWIIDNLLVAFEALHYMNSRWEQQRGWQAIKLDMSNAYDRVEWRYLEVVMVAMGFDERWTGLIMQCVSTVEYEILLNGKQACRIVPTRGLCQGDPLSPYLFILCAEGLTGMIKDAENKRLLHGIRVCRQAPTISYLLFADDSLFFLRAIVKEAEVVQQILKGYREASGQVVNFHKSSILFSRNVQQRVHNQISQLLAVQEVEHHGCYLGLPTHIGRSKVDAFAGLKGKFGRGLRSALESIMGRYWWGGGKDNHKIHWVEWRRLMRPKREGGLGFRSLHEFDMAMLAKQGWRLMREPNSLAGRVLKVKYFRRTDFLHSREAYSASLTWKGIWEARYILQAGCRRRIGNGRSTRVWEYPWLLGSSCFNIVTPRPDGCEVEWVLELIDDVMHSWRRQLVYQLFSEYETDLQQPSFSTGEFRGQTLWRLELLERIKVFLWSAYKDILPTKENLRKRWVDIDNYCLVCGEMTETGVHVLKDCQFARAVWLGSQLNLRVADLQVDSFAEFFDTVALAVDQSKLELFGLVCWSLWNNRNDILWESKRQQPQQVCEMAVRFLQEYAKAVKHKCGTRGGPRRGEIKWEPPDESHFKVNVDGVVFQHSKEFGVRAVVRDCNGEVIAAMSSDDKGLSESRRWRPMACVEHCSGQTNWD